MTIWIYCFCTGLLFWMSLINFKRIKLRLIFGDLKRHAILHAISSGLIVQILTQITRLFDTIKFFTQTTSKLYGPKGEVFGIHPITNSYISLSSYHSSSKHHIQNYPLGIKGLEWSSSILITNLYIIYRYPNSILKPLIKCGFWVICGNKSEICYLTFFYTETSSIFKIVHTVALLQYRNMKNNVRTIV